MDDGSCCKNTYLQSQSHFRENEILPASELNAKFKIEQQSFFSILLTHKGPHREAYRDFQPSLTSSAGGAKGWSDHRFRAPPAYTAQLPTLHQRKANNQYRTANQIKPTLRVSSSTQATLEQFPIHKLTKLNVA